MTTEQSQPEQKQPENEKPPTARELTRRMIEAAKARNGGKLGGKGDVDKRKFRRL